MTGIVIIAAGESSRLGSPKQLVLWRGRPLIRHTARVALDARLGPVAVVLGAAEATCRAALEGMPVRTILNPSWSSGVGGSIATGVTSMIANHPDGIIVMLCDQPLIDSVHLRKLADELKRNGNGIVATRHGGTNGAPALFAADTFPHLRCLRGNQGVRSILHGTPMLSWVPCPGAACDLDTPEDLIRLRKRE